MWTEETEHIVCVAEFLWASLIESNFLEYVLMLQGF